MARPARNLQVIDPAKKTFDLRTPKFKQLQEELARITRELEHVKAEERAEAKAQVIHLIEMFEFSAFELGFVKTQVVPPKKVKGSEKTFHGKHQKVKRVYPPKYQDPETGVTWTGMGREPLWIKGKRDDYLIGRTAPAPQDDTEE